MEGKLKDRENLEDLGLDDRLILEWIKSRRAWIVDVWLGLSTNEDFLCAVMKIMNIRFLNRRGDIFFCKGLYSIVQNTLFNHYRDQTFISVSENRHCLISEIFKLKNTIF